MPDPMEMIQTDLETIALEVVTLESGDVAALGNVMNFVYDLEKHAKEIEQPEFLKLTEALKEYLEKLIMGDASDLVPLEEGINCLQKGYHALSNEQPFEEDISAILEMLGFSGKARAATEAPEGNAQAPAGTEVEEDPPSALSLNEEDRQILEEFVVESLENLGTIEISLIDLEQNPSDLEIINAIFRPFHTIKGISSFLNLNKINRLSHSSENLLDKARDGELKIEGGVVDIILESVDMLKRMIQDVKMSLETGSPVNHEVDPEPLKNRIDMMCSQVEQRTDRPIGEILVENGSLKEEDLEKVLAKQKADPEKKIGEILIEEQKAEPKEVLSALRVQRKFNRGRIDLQVKVDTEKLDNLVDQTGELVIAQSMLKQNETIVSNSDQKLYHSINQVNQITSSLQKTAMSMRMVPIGNTFKKMLRLVRDLAKNSGKEVGLEMSGEDTEIDRNVVEELYKPMVHMIRNAVDHGLEDPDERQKSEKERKGTILLKAYQQGGHIIIEIEDDGRGLDKEKIIEKAKSRNLLTDESRLADSELYNLIFHAGFSTAKVVTDISGRGVGMDVVKRAIEKLRGRVEIQSTPGVGSKFVISLPLTLAIMEGMMVRVGQEKYIVPTLAILESFRPTKDQYNTVEGKGEMILTRGELVPLIRLDEICGVKGNAEEPWDGLVVTVEYDGEKGCMLFDELLGKEEVVIKSIGETFKNIKGVAGGAILGDGRVGLILDILGIFQVARGDFGDNKQSMTQKAA